MLLVPTHPRRELSQGRPRDFNKTCFLHYSISFEAWVRNVLLLSNALHS